jgi:hypothetical protein
MDVTRTITGTEPVTLNEMKLFLKVDYATDDALITQLIKSVREHCEEFTGRSFVESDVLWVVEAEAGDIIRLPYPDIYEVADVDGVSFRGVSVKRAIFQYSGEFEISYSTVGNCPEGVKLAIMKAVAEAYENRQNTTDGSAGRLPESTYNYLMQYTI